jgi:hypothetical protein
MSNPYDWIFESYLKENPLAKLFTEEGRKMSRLIVPFDPRQPLEPNLKEVLWGQAFQIAYVGRAIDPQYTGYVSTLQEEGAVKGTIIFIPNQDPFRVFPGRFGK